MKAIYNALIERLQTITRLKYIDMDTGQLEIPTSDIRRPAVAYPAALISIAVRRDRDITESSQICSATITLRIADDTHRRTAAHQAERTRALQIYDLIEEVRDALQGFTGEETFGPLSRQMQERERAGNGLFVYRLVFDTTFRQ